MQGVVLVGVIIASAITMGISIVADCFPSKPGRWTIGTTQHFRDRIHRARKQRQKQHVMRSLPLLPKMPTLIIVVLTPLTLQLAITEHLFLGHLILDLCLLLTNPCLT